MFDLNNEISDLVEEHGIVIETTLKVKKWGYPGGNRIPTGNVDVISVVYKSDCMGDIVETEDITTFNVKMRTGHTLNTLAYDLYEIGNHDAMKYSGAYRLDPPTFDMCLRAVKEANS